MLPKNRISGIKILTDEWRSSHLAKMTSSTIHSLMQDKLYTTGFMSYIYEKVGEELTGISANEDIDTESTRWGNYHEEEAIRKFGVLKELDFVIVQQLITVPDTRFGSTPDALIVHNESVDKTAYNVSTVEVKCFPTYQRYISLALCKTPSEIKKVNSDLYWQVLDQMDNCDCLTGYSVAYHPSFKAGNLIVVEFKKVELFEDCKFLKERKRLAVLKFEEIRDKLLSMKKY